MPYLGKRGRVLLFFGCLDLLIALSLLVPDSATRRGAFFTWLAEIAPTWTWAVAWAAIGAVCLWQAFCRRDGIGYTAAIGLKIGWAVVCLGGWMFGGVERGWVVSAYWLALAAFVWCIAGWAEPGDRKGPTWKRPSSSH